MPLHKLANLAKRFFVICLQTLFLKLFAAFLKLIRWPNLVFIALTQFLFMYCVLLPLFQQSHAKPSLNPFHFTLLIISSVLIAAAGYIINDYFDLNIDRVNKPNRLIIETFISRRYAIMWHIVLSALGVLIGFYLDFSTHATLLGLSNLACVLLLFIYSISLKKKLLSGNILISLLTAWTVLVVTWCEVRFFFTPKYVSIARVSRVTILYTAFAFVVSIIREAIKDIEDVEGDRKFGGKTMPIIWGLNAAKVYTAVWIIITLIAVLMLQVYVLQFGWWICTSYCLIFIFIPLINVFKKLFKAKTPHDFHKLSSLVKFIMLAGILSMIFFRFYA